MPYSAAVQMKMSVPAAHATLHRKRKIFLKHQHLQYYQLRLFTISITWTGKTVFAIKNVK